MKAKKLFWALAATFAALSMTVAISSCEPKDNGDNNDNPLDNIEEDTEELTIPEVAAPGEGNTTVVLYIPQSECEDAAPYILGVLDGTEKWSNEEDYAMESLGKGWWKVTVPALTQENSTNFKFRMDDGNNGWTMEPANSYKLLNDAAEYISIKEGAITDKDEPNNLLAIANCDNKVLYVQSGEWSLTPCKAPVPGGKAKFIFTPTGEVPEGKDLIFTGNFAETSWAESDRVMTKEGETYVWEGDYPENFEFKVIIKDAAGIGGAGDDGVLWLDGGNQKVSEPKAEFSFEGCFSGLCPEPTE